MEIPYVTIRIEATAMPTLSAEELRDVVLEQATPMRQWGDIYVVDYGGGEPTQEDEK